MILDKLSCLISTVITAAVCVLISVLYFDGVPFVRSIPFVGYVPVIGWISQGEIGRRIDTALEGYVKLSEKTASDAKAAKEEHDKLAAQQSLSQAAKRLAEAETAKDQAHAELAKRIADDTDDGCSWTTDDSDWQLRHH